MTGSKIKMNIDDIFTDEFVEVMVVNDLKRVYDYMTHDLKRYDEPNHGFIAIFSADPKQDKKQIKALTEGIKRVLKYYGEEV